MKKTPVQHVFLRGTKYVYRRRIPQHLTSYYGKREVKRSLHTSLLAEAKIAAGFLDLKLDNAFKSRGQIPDILMTVTDPGRQSTKELLSRGDTKQIIDAALKSSLDPASINSINSHFSQTSGTPVSRLPELYETEFSTLLPRDPKKREKHLAPRKLAISRFIEVNGDLETNQLTRKHALSMKLRLEQEGELSAATIRKTFSYLSSLFNKLNDHFMWELINPFLKMSISRRQEPKKLVKTRLRQYLSDPSHEIHSYEPEIIAAIMIMSSTGTIASEIWGLLPSDIFLNSPTPHIWIRPNGYRNIKSEWRNRKIPLVGLALRAITNFPNGLSLYQYPGGEDAFSVRALKFLRSKNYVPETFDFYSLRHNFKRSLRNCEIPKEAQDFLFGHTNNYVAMRYGDGYNLEQLATYCRKVEEDLDRYD